MPTPKAYIHLYNFERSFLDVVENETPIQTWKRVTGQESNHRVEK